MVNKYKIRSLNTQLLLKLIADKKSISRTELAKLGHLTKSTVTEIIKELMKKQLVVEVGIDDQKIQSGRKAILIELNAGAGYAISVNISPSRFEAILTDLGRNLIAEFKVKNILISSKTVIQLIKNAVDYFLPYTEKSVYKIIAMTVAIHGVVQDNKILISPNYDLDDADLYAHLKENFDFPIILENEANLAALAHITNNLTLNNIAVLTIDTGVGCGIMIDRKLYRGSFGAGGEIGHIVIYPDGLECRCGRRGCLEQYCSIRRLLSTYRFFKNNEELSFEDLVQDYLDQDPQTVDLIRKTEKNLAIGINNILTVLDLDKVYIHSDLAENIPNLCENITYILKNEFKSITPLTVSLLDQGAILIGASYTGIAHFFQQIV